MPSGDNKLINPDRAAVAVMLYHAGRVLLRLMLHYEIEDSIRRRCLLLHLLVQYLHLFLHG